MRVPWVRKPETQDPQLQTRNPMIPVITDDPQEMTDILEFV